MEAIIKARIDATNSLFEEQQAKRARLDDCQPRASSGEEDAPETPAASSSTDGRRFACDQPGCNYRSNQKSNLNTHKAGVHGINVVWHVRGGMQINGFGPDQDKHFGVGNPEWDLRSEFGNRRQHAPFGLCRCLKNSTTGNKGTFVSRPRLQKQVNNLYTVLHVIEWADFEKLYIPATRLSCMGYRENKEGRWETIDGVSIEEDRRRRVARSRLRKWARSVKARPYALHWLEEHAQRVEERRLAKVAEAVRNGSVYDPDCIEDLGTFQND